jgi:hypothetical protein
MEEHAPLIIGKDIGVTEISRQDFICAAIRELRIRRKTGQHNKGVSLDVIEEPFKLKFGDDIGQTLGEMIANGDIIAIARHETPLWHNRYDVMASYPDARYPEEKSQSIRLYLSTELPLRLRLEARSPRHRLDRVLASLAPTAH